MTDKFTIDTNMPTVLDKDRQKEKLREPPKYKVVMINDDFTPMDWVVAVLQQYFGKSEDEAAAIMMEVHTKGRGVAGIYTKDIAETKAFVVNTASQEQEFPFRAEIEQE